MDNKITIAIHQPNYIPWIGYFHKMAICDIFVILDNVQYEKNLFQNRNRIKTPQGAMWLSLPIKRKFPQLLNCAILNNFSEERKKHLKTIEFNYKKAKYFNYLFPEIKKIFENDWQYLSQLNISLINLFRSKLEIKTKIEIASNYNISGRGTDLLINICKKFNADTYISGKGGFVGGKKYLKESKFKINNIKLKYNDFNIPIYNQLWKDFVPNLSVIDLIFNYGPKSLEIILSSNNY